MVIAKRKIKGLRCIDPEALDYWGMRPENKINLNVSHTCY